jgi:hypothetical protein
VCSHIALTNRGGFVTIHESAELESLSISKLAHMQIDACGAFDRVNFHHEPSPINDCKINR